MKITFVPVVKSLWNPSFFMISPTRCFVYYNTQRREYYRSSLFRIYAIDDGRQSVSSAFLRVVYKSDKK